MGNGRIHILLVEDDPQDAFLLRKLLAEDGANPLELAWVERLSEGLARLQKGSFDVVLLDLSLPDSQGLQTFTHLYQAHAEVPIVVLTGVNDDALAVAAVKAGAQDYLVKGQFDTHLLQRAIRYAIERYRLQVALEQSRLREQEERERAENLRHRQSYLAIAEGNARADVIAGIAEDVLDSIASRYQKIVLHYVRAVRAGEDRPSQSIRVFAAELASLRFGARDIIHLHLRFLDAFVDRFLPQEQRALSNDARLGLLEVMGELLDIYLKTSSNNAVKNEAD